MWAASEEGNREEEGMGLGRTCGRASVSGDRILLCGERERAGWGARGHLPDDRQFFLLAAPIEVQVSSLRKQPEESGVYQFNV
jgi:hypothetical protein